MRKEILWSLAAASCVCVCYGSSAAKADSDTEDASYVAHLAGLNSKVTGSDASGEARFTVKGDTLTIHIDVSGLPPAIMHLQHFHGFTDNREAHCATAAADKNGDGIIDLIETEPVSGTTMVPFHDDPVSMQIVNDTYPKASVDGSHH